MRRRPVLPSTRVTEVFDGLRAANQAFAPDELPPPPPVGAWAPDILGRGHEARTIPLGSDEEGEVAATLVHYRPDADQDRTATPETTTTLPSPRFVVLYLHGWTDYLLNHEIGPFWATQGGAFYGLDLRKYGRSLRAGQTPGYITDLATYDEDIEAALDLIAEDHPDLPIVLMAHSTGGLTATLWSARHPGRTAGLVLVAPWLEVQGAALVRSLSTPIVREIARAFPRRELPGIDLGYYHRTISATRDGEWDLVPAWRPEHSFPATYGWLAAVLEGHGAIAEGIHVAEPVLVLRSARTLIGASWREEMAAADIVIEVNVIAERALTLAESVSVATLEGALHDVLLSPRPIRERAYEHIARWSRAHLPL
ncbi:alpha/beta hydrolase [Serinibacter salmoneus]|uniref:Alpha-beta hydrolase superfamily lysophospholipase n=1 Tax=Serinibacter salmoneus TaxID=556530 RepID=A0A2A9D3T9_9MICO|nr:alpha/beta hydrolase [Serinibacter salmoneus]PFG20622.1 alpha-beta hydrolase superfamily lysophospholipase [Serinibacter salmoneus]